MATQQALTMPETSAAGLTASPVRLPWVVMRKTPAGAALLLDADDQQDDDGGDVL